VAVEMEEEGKRSVCERDEGEKTGVSREIGDGV
jgi:hypothetical protein